MASAARQERTDLAVLARGGTLSFVGTVVGALLGWVFLLVVSRGLRAHGAGLLFEAVALFMIFSNIAELGADTGLVRMIPHHRAVGSVRDAAATIRLAFRPPLLAALFLGTAMFAFADALADVFMRGPHGSDGALYIRVLAFFLPLGTATTLLLAATRGFGTMVPYVAVQNLAVPALRPLLMLGVIAAGLGGAAAALAWAVPAAIGCGAAALALSGLLRRAQRRPQAADEPSRPRRELSSEFWRFSAPRGLAGFFQVAILWLDVLLVGAFVSASDAGIYTAASRYVVAGTFALNAVGLVIAPHISGLLARGRTDQAKTMFQTATWWLMAISWPLYLTMAVFSPLLMGLFGPEFARGSTALVILAFCMLVLMSTGNNKIVLLMGGGSGINLGITALSLTINVGLNLLLIPRMGMNGAALAWTASTVADNALTTLAVWKKLRLAPFGAGYPLVAVAAVACYGGLGVVARYALGMSLASFAVFAIAATLPYGWLLWRSRDTLHLSAFRSLLRARLGAPGTDRTAQPGAALAETTTA